mgnify:CR=1 FL=1
MQSDLCRHRTGHEIGKPLIITTTAYPKDLNNEVYNAGRNLYTVGIIKKAGIEYYSINMKNTFYTRYSNNSTEIINKGVQNYELENA